MRELYWDKTEVTRIYHWFRTVQLQFIISKSIFSVDVIYQRCVIFVFQIWIFDELRDSHMLVKLAWFFLSSQIGLWRTSPPSPPLCAALLVTILKLSWPLVLLTVCWEWRQYCFYFYWDEATASKYISIFVVCVYIVIWPQRHFSEPCNSIVPRSPSGPLIFRKRYSVWSTWKWSGNG